MKINNIKNAGLDFLHTVREKTSEVLKSAGEVAKRGAVIALSGVIAVGCAVPAASAASDDSIDTTKTGTMHIRKYDMTAAQEGGVDLNQFIANGEQDPDAEEALAKYELEGVQFSPTFAGEIATYSQEGTVILTYSIPARHAGRTAGQHQLQEQAGRVGSSRRSVDAADRFPRTHLSEQSASGPLPHC